jgi:hypothetical protein
VENLDGLYLGGINERAFLVSPDAVFLDGQLRDNSKAASARLGDEGVAAFTRRAAGQSAGEDEFMQDELF